MKVVSENFFQKEEKWHLTLTGTHISDFRSHSSLEFKSYCAIKVTGRARCELEERGEGADGKRPGVRLI
jgi:hypothetical protein